MCACTTSVKVLSPRDQFSAVAVSVFAVARAKKKNQKMNNFVTWRFTTLTKLSIDVSGVVSHTSSKKHFIKM